MPDAWSMKGQYFEACSCDIACPCIFLSDPTQEVCTVLLGYHIDQGESGKQALGGLNFAIAAFCRGNMLKNKWEAAIYVDQRASGPQRAALESILGGQAGGIFAALGGFIGKVHGIRSVPIEFRADGKKRSLRIPAIAEMRVETIAGADGKDAKITNPPFGVATEIWVAKSEKLTLKDHGWNWDVSGKNSFVAPFAASGP